MMLLQAAIGFGMFLLFITWGLIFIVFPGLMVYTSIKFNSKRRRVKPYLTKRDYLIISTESFFLSALITLAIASLIYLLLFLTVDFSNT